MVEFRAPKTWRTGAGVKPTDLNREIRDQIRKMQTEVLILQQGSGGSVDPGTILPFPGDTITIPSGWLLCDGRSLLIDDYPTLAGVLGSSYGTLTTTHFTLPDYRGKMMRGNPVVVQQQILGRGNATGASSPRSDTLNSNMSFAGVNVGVGTSAAISSAGDHYHGYNLDHRHLWVHNHNIRFNAVNHAHGFNTHSHNTGGPSAQRGNGSGNVASVAQGGHTHDGFSTGFGNANDNLHDCIGTPGDSGWSTNSGNTNSSNSGDHNHGANSRDHTHTLTHSHTIDTLPAYVELNFLVKT